MEKTLLIADDAAIMRAMIRDAAAQAGWRVIGEACDGQQAAEQYRQLRPAAVTLDLVMPHTDGLAALRAIKAIDPQARVLVVSALDQRRILEQSFAAGATDFLVKPFTPELLIEALEKMVRPATLPTARGSALQSSL